jgi:DNA-binding GntR family transcriptional regulator
MVVGQAMSSPVKTPIRARPAGTEADGAESAVPFSSAGSMVRPMNTRRGRVVKSVLLRIFAGEIVGGDRLVEEELAEQLGVSRTPIREALSELAAIGVIWIKPNHGAMVRPFGPKQISEIYQIRRILESEATRSCDALIDRVELQQIRDRMQEIRLASEKQRTDAWSQNALMLDQRLHEMIAASSGSERLAEEIHRYWTLARTIGEAVGNAAHTQDCALVEHTAVIDALLQHQPHKAADAMAEHIMRREEAAVGALSPRLRSASGR